jgi:hypothetical protein
VYRKVLFRGATAMAAPMLLKLPLPSLVTTTASARSAAAVCCYNVVSAHAGVAIAVARYAYRLLNMYNTM